MLNKFDLELILINGTILNGEDSKMRPIVIELVEYKFLLNLLNKIAGAC